LIFHEATTARRWRSSVSCRDQRLVGVCLGEAFDVGDGAGEVGADGFGFEDASVGFVGVVAQLAVCSRPMTITGSTCGGSG
jgi:hypothetical protein